MTSRAPIRPKHVPATQYAAAREAYDVAKIALHEAERQQSASPHPSHHEHWVDRLDRKRLALLEAELAMTTTGAEYNSSASDLEGLRELLLVELATAREALSVAPPPQPAPLASATPDAIRTHADTLVAYAAAEASWRAAFTPTLNRLGCIFGLARRAQQIVWAERKAARLPTPTHAVPDFNGRGSGAPSTVAEIDRVVRLIEAERTSSNDSSGLDYQIRELRERIKLRELEAKWKAEADERAKLPQLEADYCVATGLTVAEFKAQKARDAAAPTPPAK
jgi:hypothetical protein